MAKKTKKGVARKVIEKTVPTHLETVPSRVKVVATKPTVDEITTTTEIETVPTIEVRKPATLAQALQERATIVAKPEKRVVSRTVRKRKVA